MCGNTHAGVGAAAAMLVMQPSTVEEIIVCGVLGAAGGLLPDVDIESSKASKYFRGICVVCIVGVVFCVARLCVKGADFPMDWVSETPDAMKLAGAAMFVAITAVGMRSPHRSFTHSVLSVALYAVAAFMLMPNHMWAFLTGIISHVLLDILNKKKVRIFHPMSGGVALNVCTASGVVDKLLFWAAVIVCLVYCGHELL